MMMSVLYRWPQRSTFCASWVDHYIYICASKWTIGKNFLKLLMDVQLKIPSDATTAVHFKHFIGFNVYSNCQFFLSFPNRTNKTVTANKHTVNDIWRNHRPVRYQFSLNHLRQGPFYSQPKRNVRVTMWVVQRFGQCRWGH